MPGYVFAVYAAEGGLADPPFSACDAPDENAATKMAMLTLEPGEALAGAFMLNELGFPGFAKTYPGRVGAVRVGKRMEP